MPRKGLEWTPSQLEVACLLQQGNTPAQIAATGKCGVRLAYKVQKALKDGDIPEDGRLDIQKAVQAGQNLAWVYDQLRKPIPAKVLTVFQAFWTPKGIVFECPDTDTRDFIAKTVAEKHILIRVKGE